MGLWKDKTRKHWCYRFQYQGQGYYGRGYKDRRSAEVARSKRRKQVKTPIQTGMAYSEAVNKYLDHAERRFVKAVYKYKKYVYQQFFIFLENDFQIDELTTPTIKAYLETRHSNNNYNVHRRDLSAFFTYAKDILEVIDRNPIKKIEKMPHTPKKKVIPQESDVIKLVLAADPKTDERDLLLVLLNTLARIDEVLRLTWDDVNFDKRILTKTTRKTKDGSWKEVPVKINDELYDILWKRWEHREQDIWVFYNKRYDDRYQHRPKFMKGLCKRAGIIPHFGFHTLRHLMASLLNDNPKISYKTIQNMLGHADQKTTEIYLHELKDADTVAVDSISGKFTQKNEKVPPKSATKDKKRIPTKR